MFNASEWVNLIVRWAHVFSAILWVGATYYFTWLDGQLRRAERTGSNVWMVHSGGFYTVVKHKTLGVPPDQVHWFRWEAMSTFVTGFVLLLVVYDFGGLLVDPLNPRVSLHMAEAAGLGTLILGWVVYDLLALSPLARIPWLFALVGLALSLGLLAMLRDVMSARAAYLHMGALFGTIMAANVWVRILPPQRRMIAAAARGDVIDPALGAGAKERSKHNTFIVLPTVMLMISNHFPTATYGSRYAVPVLGALMVAGWIAAAILRRA